MFMMDFIISLVGVLLSVAFFTLMERKVMGLMHFRKGPNKVVWVGLSQPMADALKLLTKETTKLNSVKATMFLIGPSIGLLVMFLIWFMFEFSFSILPVSVKIILIFTLMGMNIYSMLMMSWGSNSKYAMLGGHRAVAQVMSYEVCMFITTLVLVFLWKSYSFTQMNTVQQGMWSFLLMLPVFFTWTMVCMAEANRTPFDMAEGESEIVSGFNVEYGGGMFAFIFISEYGMIIMLSFVSTVFFLGGDNTLVKTLMFMFVFVWTRCSFPRVRYNNLMMLSWKMALPFILAMLTMTTFV